MTDKREKIIFIGAEFQDQKNAFDERFQVVNAGVASAEDIVSALDSSGSDTTHIVALTNAVDVALDFAAKHPNRICGLILVNPLLNEFPINRLGEVNATSFILIGQEASAEAQTTADTLRTALPRNGKLTIPFTGDNPQLEDPETFNELILGFISDLACSGGCCCGGGC